ncbi:MAG: hypothetical protein ACYSU0_03030 [Planctomycetota bacterium]
MSVGMTLVVLIACREWTVSACLRRLDPLAAAYSGVCPIPTSTRSSRSTVGSG